MLFVPKGSRYDIIAGEASTAREYFRFTNLASLPYHHIPGLFANLNITASTGVSAHEAATQNTHIVATTQVDPLEPTGTKHI